MKLKLEERKMFRSVLGSNGRCFSTSNALWKTKKGPKGDTTLVQLKSSVSDFTMQGRRARLGDKLETLAFDPKVQMTVLFKEAKKIKTLSVVGKKAKEWNFPQDPVYPPDFNVPANMNTSPKT